MDTLTSIKVLRQVIESGTFVAATERMDLSIAMGAGRVALPLMGRRGPRRRRRIGLAALPQIFFEDPPFKDVLTPILTDYPPQERTLYVVYVGRRYLALKSAPSSIL